MTNKPNYQTIERALNDLIDAWESLPGPQEYSIDEVQRWLDNRMKESINRARIVLGRQTEP